MDEKLPLYACHKQVRASKIVKVDGRLTDSQATLELADGTRRVDMAWVVKHRPQPGGYFVEYEGGYFSFSPAEPFEAGYTRVD